MLCSQAVGQEPQLCSSQAEQCEARAAVTLNLLIRRWGSRGHRSEWGVSGRSLLPSQILCTPWKQALCSPPLPHNQAEAH